MQEQATESRTVTAAEIEPAHEFEDPVWDRQSRIPGFEQEKLVDATVLLIGAGALGGEVGEGLLRKGVGKLKVCDGDVVEVSNLNRQRFFEEDLFENKAVALTGNLIDEGTTGTEIVGIPHYFEDAVELGYDLGCDIAVCAPDNDETRAYTSDYYYNSTPVVFTGLDLEAIGGYVFSQQPGGPCFRCCWPDSEGGGACPGAPAVKDPAKVVGGIALYAVDSILMNRPRSWDVFEFWLSGMVPPSARSVGRREDCPSCGGG